MRDHIKLSNIRRDPRVALSFNVPREPRAWICPYAVVDARATVEPSVRIGDLMAAHAEVDVSPGSRPFSRGIRDRVHREVLDHAEWWHRPVDNQPRPAPPRH